MPWALKMTSYAGSLLLILLIYFGYRYFVSVKILNLKPSWVYGLFYIMLLLLFLAYPLAGNIMYLKAGYFSHTDFPPAVIYLFWFGLVCMGVMLNWLLMHDLLRPAAAWITGRDPVIIRRWFAAAFILMAGLTVVYTAGKMILDTKRIVVEEIGYTLAGNTGKVAPLTIVHIADLHADRYTGEKKMSRYVRKVNDAGPDIVIFSGDLISSGVDYIQAGADALAGIQATHGTWFVMGDHDYWVGTEEIAEALQSRSINVLQNENALIRHNDSAIIKITGVTELYSTQVDPGVLAGLLDEESGEDLHLLASHQASERLIEKANDSGVHQLLAGHTHGGQIVVPLFFYPVTAVRAESPYVRGSWHFGNMLMHINNGLGFTLAPVRYNAPAKVTVIRVQQAP
jgi:uncharacterized protein